jgi:hypothetical protein
MPMFGVLARCWRFGWVGYLVRAIRIPSSGYCFGLALLFPLLAPLGMEAQQNEAAVGVAPPPLESSAGSDVYWREGNAALEQGDPVRAAESYENLLATRGMAVEILHNLALAKYQSGEPAAALALWECAFQIRSGDAGVNGGLRWVRERLKVTTPPMWKRWLDRRMLNFTAFIVLAAVWTAVLMNVAMWLAAAQRGRFSGTLRVAWCVAGISGVLLAGQWAWYVHRPNARVVVEEGIVRQAPVIEARRMGSLALLDEVRVIRQHNDWCEVSRNGERLGWVSASELVGTMPEVEGRRRHILSSALQNRGKL